jgi:myo-inositol 2-dehydrogenase / D-chiro-inositol 1-dehydrogenase
MAGAHLPGLSSFPDVELVGFCDVVAEKAQQLAAGYPGAQNFTVPSEMIAAVRPDIVYILLPPFAHGPAERAALAARVPFFVEKPIGNDLGLLREISREVETTGLLTAVGYMTRYRESVQRAHALFQQDPPILGLGGWISGPPFTSTAPILQWWVIEEKSGGQMVEQVTHTVDLARYLMGDVVEVFAHGARGFNQKYGDRLQKGYNIVDAEVMSLRFKSGAVGTLFSSCSTAAGGDVSLDVYAAEHTAIFRGWEHTVQIISADSEEVEEIPGEGDIFLVEDRAVIDAVKSGDSSRVMTSYPDAFKTSEVTLGANESMKTGRPVAIA